MYDTKSKYKKNAKNKVYTHALSVRFGRGNEVCLDEDVIGVIGSDDPVDPVEPESLPKLHVEPVLGIVNPVTLLVGFCVDLRMMMMMK